MTNILHSSKSDSWRTPQDIIESARIVLNYTRFGEFKNDWGPRNIDLDPASDTEANERVQADTFFTREDDGLTLDWSGSVFLNPPGGKRGKHSLTGLFWSKLMDEVRAEHVTHAIFLAFSLEAMQMTQGYHKLSIPDFPFCVPRKRLRFEGPDGVAKSPTHGNVIVYVPGTIDRTDDFLEEFAKYGAVKR